MVIPSLENFSGFATSGAKIAKKDLLKEFSKTHQIE